jgi:hypothetical protein
MRLFCIRVPVFNLSLYEVIFGHSFKSLHFYMIIYYSCLSRFDYHVQRLSLFSKLIFLLIFPCFDITFPNLRYIPKIYALTTWKHIKTTRLSHWKVTIKRRSPIVWYFGILYVLLLEDEYKCLISRQYLKRQISVSFYCHNFLIYKY